MHAFVVASGRPLPLAARMQAAYFEKLPSAAARRSTALGWTKMASKNNGIFCCGVLLMVMATCAAKSEPAPKTAPASKAASAPETAPATDAASAGVFDISKLGATSNGKADSSKAIQDAWKSACGAAGDQTVLIPKGDFLSGPLNLTGPCKGHVTLQLDGTLLGSNDLDKYDGLAGWITIGKVDNLAINGSGTLDGQGTAVWQKDAMEPKDLPDTLMLYNATNGTISGIRFLNAKSYHMGIRRSKDIVVRNVTITGPGDSPRTVGIVIIDSTDITVKDTAIGTGDDCIAIGGGSTAVEVAGVTCGPGEGINVGCLGKYKDETDVTDVTVRNCLLKNTTTGVGVKTYPRAARPIMTSNVVFENIVMDNVANPIIIDQNHCPEKVCRVRPGEAKVVTVKDVTFRNITGTSSTPEAINLQCSDKQACTGVKVIDVNVKYGGGNNKTVAVCDNAKGTAKGTALLDCLQD